MNPRNPTTKGADARGIERLAADLGCIPADAEQVIRDVAECERVIRSTIPESAYPDTDPEPFDEATGPMPVELPRPDYRPMQRFVGKMFKTLGAPVPIADLTDSEQVRERVYAHDVADVALSHGLGSTRYTCDIRAHGREFHGIGTTYGLAASDALFRLRHWRDLCDERHDQPEQDDEDGGAE